MKTITAFYDNICFVSFGSEFERRLTQGDLFMGKFVFAPTTIRRRRNVIELRYIARWKQKHTGFFMN